MTVQDWGVTYDELEPHYDKFEYLCGISGKAGNLNGKIQPGGNPFEGPRSRDYPNPPLRDGLRRRRCSARPREETRPPSVPVPGGQHVAALHQSAGRARSAPAPIAASARSSAAATIRRSSAQTTILPVLMRKKNFELRTECEVHAHRARRQRPSAPPASSTSTRKARNSSSRPTWSSCAPTRCTTCGCCCCRASASPTTRATGQGVIGKNYAYQIVSSVDVFFEDKILNPVHRRRRARHRRRRLQRRQFRPYRPGLHRRRLSRLLEHQRPADRASSDAQGHAEMGRQVEAGRRQELPDHCDRSRRTAR